MTRIKSSRRCSVKTGGLKKLRKFYNKTPVLESFLLRFYQILLKRDSDTGASCKTFKNSNLEEHLRTTVSKELILTLCHLVSTKWSNTRWKSCSVCKIGLRYLHGGTCALLEKFIEIQGSLLLTFFICLHNQLSSFNSIIVQIPEKRDSSNSKNEWLLLSATFTAKPELVFDLTFENAFS